MNNIITPLKCFIGDRFDEACVYRTLCPQYGAYFHNVFLGLLLASVVINFIIPIILYRFIKPSHLPHFYAFYPHALDIRTDEGKEKAIYWLKDRLLLAWSLFAIYSLWLFGTL